MGKSPSWPVVTGPLVVHADGFRADLEEFGFSCWAASRHMYVLDAVSRWLSLSGLEAADLDPLRVEEFLRVRRSEGRARPLTARGLEALLCFLRRCGALAVEPPPAVVGPVDQAVFEFGIHLRDDRGLSPRTIVGYGRTARLFLQACAPDRAAAGCGLDALGSAAVTGFVLARCSGLSVGSAGNVVSAVRGLLRFAFLRGWTATSLAECVPAAASWRDSGRSRALAPAEVDRLLAACDVHTAVGRRDLAVLTVLARLGLRSGEAAGLCLDDIDWRAGELAVTGKGGRRDRLPVPADVGERLADYCQRGRPATTSRTLFVHGRAPFGPLSSGAVGHIVVRAGERAGLGRVGAHRLRHTAASAMRQAGAPMFEIGQVLRHRFVVTTAIYAKDDLDALARIARPWPGATP
jgi:integrase/recombinase XerD